MSLLDIFCDIMRTRRVAKENINRRGVTEYQPSQIGGFIEDDAYMRNLVCSGDCTDLRSETITSLCVSATNANIPVIVLHQGDTKLVNKFHTTYGNHPSYIEIGPYAKRFDPFYQLNNSQISKIIIESAPQKYALSCDGQAYIDTMTGFLSGKGRPVTLTGLYQCPHSTFSMLLSSATANGTLPQSVAQSLQITLAQGQKEAHRVKAYMDELYDECIALLPKSKSDYVNCVSIFHAVQQNAVLNFDIISDVNTLLLRAIAEQLKILIKRRVPFLLILDNIPIRDDNSMKDISLTNSGGFACAIAGDDVLSLCDGNEQLFGALVGHSSKWFVFHHNPGPGSEMWSVAFSKYKMIDTTTNFGHGYSSGHGSGYSLGGGHLSSGTNWNNNHSSHQGYSYVNKDEAIIRGEEISRLPPRSGYVYTAQTREIAHIGTFLPQ